MRRLYLLFFIIFGCIVGVSAQERTHSDNDAAKREKMLREVRDFKVKYLAQEMELTDDQKQKFIELYEEISEKKDACYRPAREMERNLKREEDASEADYQQVTEAMNKANAEFAEIEKIYNEKFSEFLSQKQIYKMKEAENSFRSKLEEMRQSKKKHQDKHKKHNR